jgi:hypothetical protein
MKRLASLLAACLALSCSNSAAPLATQQPDATTSLSATGGSGTGLAQDATAQAILAKLGLTTPQGGSGTGLCQDATLQVLLANIGGGAAAVTAATVTNGQSYNLLTTDGIIRFDTSGDGGVATATMNAPQFVGQTITFYWWNWSAAQIPPTINVIASGSKMVPFSGQQTAGLAGLVSSTNITVPGASFTIKWDGTEWVTP